MLRTSETKNRKQGNGDLIIIEGNGLIYNRLNDQVHHELKISLKENEIILT